MQMSADGRPQGQREQPRKGSSAFQPCPWAQGHRKHSQPTVLACTLPADLWSQLHEEPTEGPALLFMAGRGPPQATLPPFPKAPPSRAQSCHRDALGHHCPAQPRARGCRKQGFCARLLPQPPEGAGQGPDGSADGPTGPRVHFPDP